MRRLSLASDASIALSTVSDLAPESMPLGLAWCIAGSRSIAHQPGWKVTPVHRSELCVRCCSVRFHRTGSRVPEVLQTAGGVFLVWVRDT